MKTRWDYTKLAKAYLKRPDYAVDAIDAMLKISNVSRDDKVCDMGAGAAHLTLLLAKRQLDVLAIEPNDAMRKNGKLRTGSFTNVSWYEGTGELSGQADDLFEMVTFGSSFNVCDRQLALLETKRILKPHGWFACMWNHRHLDDPVQFEIEKIIRSHVPEYGYGSRREDQSSEIDRCGLFKSVIHLDSKVLHRQTIDGCVEAWRSHATLQRQSGASFPEVIQDIEKFLAGLNKEFIRVPYSTNIWMAQARSL